MLRPDIVWFGETLPAKVLEEAVILSKIVQVFFVIGTSNIVEPAASLPFIALRSGALVVEINTERTSLYGYAHFTLLGKAAEILPHLLDAIKS